MTEHSMAQSDAWLASTSAEPSRRVTDAATRVNHGLMAVTFLLAYITAESEYWRLLHVTMGYTLAGLLVYRLAFGVVGPRHARLNLLWRRATLAAQWLRDVLDWRHWSVKAWSQAPMMGVNASIAVVMVSVVVLTWTGYVSFEEWGPSWWVDMSSELHEGASNFMLGGVLLHIASVLVQSVWKNSSYWQRMWSGRVPGKGPDVARHNLMPVAALIVTSAVGFWFAVWSGWVVL